VPFDHCTVTEVAWYPGHKISASLSFVTVSGDRKVKGARGSVTSYELCLPSFPVRRQEDRQRSTQLVDILREVLCRRLGGAGAFDIVGKKEGFATLRYGIQKVRLVACHLYG
jgi:hypothetical protein